MTEHLNQLNVKMQGIGNAILSHQQLVFAFENKLELFIVISKKVVYHILKDCKNSDACTASNSTKHFDFQQLECDI